jgi:phosphoribosylformylglycinamidine (FGAM) synthase-like amidotransferase family enzyme
VLRYCDPAGVVAEAANPHGSVDHLAGVCNAAGNVVGMMPHPERGADPTLGGADGRLVLASLRAAALAAL